MVAVLLVALQPGCSQEGPAEGADLGAAGPALRWARSFGGPGDDRGQGLAVAPGGDLLLSGFFVGSADFGGGLLPGNGRESGVLGRYRGDDGQQRWSRAFSAAGTDSVEALALAVDAAGNVLVTGFFSGTAELGTGPLRSAGGTDVFVAKYDGGGGPLWSRRLGGPGNERGLAVATRADGDLYVAGFFADQADLGTGPLAASGPADAFLLRCAGPDGAIAWVRGLGGPGRDVATALAADPGGDVLITGFVSDTADLGLGALAGRGGTDLFLARYAADGGARWARRLGGPQDDLGAVLVSDPGDGVAVAGFFAADADFGGTILRSAGASDAFLARYGRTDGVLWWARRFGGAQNDAALGAAAAGELLLLGGYFSGEADFGVPAGPLRSAGSTDVFAGAFRLPDGAPQWARGFGGSGGDYAQAIGAAADGAAVLTGAFAGTVDFGAGPLRSAGRSDAFLLRLGP